MLIAYQSYQCAIFSDDTHEGALLLAADLLRVIY